MSSKLTSLSTAHYILLARSIIVILGCIAAWWGIVAFSVFWKESSTDRLVPRIIAGEPYKIKELSRQLSIINSTENPLDCRPAAVRNVAIIQLRIVEVNPNMQTEESLRSLRKMIGNSLSCAPADPFLWLALYRAGTAKSELNATGFKYLRMSYLLGPNEGWIALKRNRITIGDGSFLPHDLVEAELTEFAGLVHSQFYNDAADIVGASAQPMRNLLLEKLKGIKERDRNALAKVLYDKGLDVAGIGLIPPAQTPWH